MAQLSRTKKYQDLRDKLEEETTEAQVQTSPSRLSRVQASKLSHANQPLYPHEEINAKPISKELPKSPVMDDLLDEVKHYNVENGYRYTDDTQINILKQLDGKETRRRNAHFIPMEDDEDELGSTMQMPKPTSEEVNGVATYMPNQKLTRINPVRVEKKEPVKQPVEEPKEAVKPKSERIVLGNADIRADDPVEESDKLTFFDQNTDEFDRTLENRVEATSKKKPKKVKKTKKKAAKVRTNTQDAPSAKMRMRAGDIDNIPAQKKTKKSGTILNVILVILILLLIASIGVTIYFIWQMGL